MFIEILQTIGVGLLTILGVYLGFRSSKLKPPYWAIGYAVPLLFVLLVTASRRMPIVSFYPPASWVMSGRTEYALFGIACTALFTTLLPKLAARSQKITVGVFMVLATLYLSILPYLLPLMNRAYHESLETEVDEIGMCLQRTGYTCGPAAAVTALHVLGVEAREGELAVYAHTSPITGTDPDDLCRAIETRFGGDDVTCEYHYFKKLSDLPTDAPTIALIKYSFFVDHYVTVLEVTEQSIVFGDPLTGKKTFSNKDFESIWRHSGVVVRRVRA